VRFVVPDDVMLWLEHGDMQLHSPAVPDELQQPLLISNARHRAGPQQNHAVTSRVQHGAFEPMCGYAPRPGSG
jgi:hypothetical protein